MAGKRVLVVDDELPMQEVLVALLQTLGHTAETASSGAQALCLLERQSFELFFVDLQMPGMKGNQLAIHLKQQLPAVPVVLITGRRPQTDFPSVDRVLFKPFSAAELKSAIESLFPNESGENERT